jgi:hypothetical protein
MGQHIVVAADDVGGDRLAESRAWELRAALAGHLARSLQITTQTSASKRLSTQR